MNYRNYRGRRRGRTILATLLVVALLALLGYAALTFFDLPLPFLQGGEDDAGLNLITEPSSADPSSEVKPPPTEPSTTPSTSTPGGEEEPTHLDVSTGLWIPLSRLDEAGYAQEVVELCQSEDFNAVLIDVKEADGRLLYASAAFSAYGDPSLSLSEAIAPFVEADIRVVCRLSAFRDGLYPRENRSLALHTASGATWLDREYISWFDPAQTGSTDYLAILGDELLAAGASEIVLDDFTYPTVGKINLISYSEAAPGKQEALSTALESLQARHSSPLFSVMLTEEAARSGIDETGGQITADLNQFAAQLYYPVTFSAGEGRLDDFPVFKALCAAGRGLPVVTLADGDTWAAAAAFIRTQGGFLYRADGAYGA